MYSKVHKGLVPSLQGRTGRNLVRNRPPRPSGWLGSNKYCLACECDGQRCFLKPTLNASPLAHGKTLALECKRAYTI